MLYRIDNNGRLARECIKNIFQSLAVLTLNPSLDTKIIERKRKFIKNRWIYILHTMHTSTKRPTKLRIVRVYYLPLQM